MVQAHAHLACRPDSAELLYAVLWFAHRDDVYGWFVGARGDGFLAAYFKLEDHYRDAEERLLRSALDEVYGPWLQSGPQGELPVPHAPPVPEPLCHELLRLQDRFVRHWLCFADDPAAAARLDALRARHLPVHAVNLRADRLGSFEHGAPFWRHDAPGAEHRLLIELSRRWPLDLRIAS